MHNYNIVYFKKYKGNVCLKGFNTIKQLDEYTLKFKDKTDIIDELKKENKILDFVSDIFIVNKKGEPILGSSMILTNNYSDIVSIDLVKELFSEKCYDKEFMQRFINFYINAYLSMEYKDTILSILFDINNNLSEMNENNMESYYNIKNYKDNLQKFLTRELCYSDVKINKDEIKVIKQKDKLGNDKIKYSNIRRFYFILKKISNEILNKYSYIASKETTTSNQITNNTDKEEFLSEEDYKGYVENLVKNNQKYNYDLMYEYFMRYKNNIIDKKELPIDIQEILRYLNTNKEVTFEKFVRIYNAFYNIRTNEQIIEEETEEIKNKIIN